MDLGIRVDDAPADLPAAAFRWDAETEILAARFAPEEGARGLTGTVELAAGDGPILAVDVERGVLCGIEVVVWPRGDAIDRLEAPAGTPGRVVIPARPSQPGVGAVEVDAAIRLRRGPDGRVLHFAIGEPRPSRAVRIAGNVTVELDADNRLAGVWLEDVPPFPGEGA